MLSFRMTALFAAVAVSSLAVVAGCGVSTDSESANDEAPEVGEVQSAMDNGTGFTIMMKSELEADGWTCTLLSGTSLTFCTKPGESGSWSCNDRGTCTQNKTTPPPRKPPVFSSSGVVIGGTFSREP